MRRSMEKRRLLLSEPVLEIVDGCCVRLLLGKEKKEQRQQLLLLLPAEEPSVLQLLLPSEKTFPVRGCCGVVLLYLHLEQQQQQEQSRLAREWLLLLLFKSLSDGLLPLVLQTRAVYVHRSSTSTPQLSQPCLLLLLGLPHLR